MPKKTSNDEKFVMNFFQKGNNNKQIGNVQNLTQNFTESEYIPEDEDPEELTEIEKELDKDKKRLISEKIGKKLKAKGYSAKQVGAFTFYIKTREEYTAALRQTLELKSDGMSNTLTTVQKDNYLFDSYRIRKLTPRECFKLMGFTDEDFNRIHGISNTQLYKMAGNSIVVNVLEAIFKQLFKENENAKIYFMP